MCGIAGFTFEDKQLLSSILNTIAHRGPDQNGTYFDQGISLGHVRLSILDLSIKGKQPMSNLEGNIIISFNGEIYNFKEIKDELEELGHRFISATDTEVIIYAYQEWGIHCINKFNGMFAFCLYDKTIESIFLVRDRLGIKPLYYAKTNRGLIFCSELKGILEGGVLREINKKSLNSFLALRYFPGENTIINGVKKLEPRTILKFNLKSKAYTKIKFWELHHNQIRVKKKHAITQFTDLLGESVRLRMIADVPVGAFLSGGIDSSSIVALMSKYVNSLKTFSVGFGHEETDELKHAKKVSDFFGTEHKEIIVGEDSVKKLAKVIWHADEPVADPAMIPIFILSQEAKKKVKVVLTGDGADETLAGYEHYKILSYLRAFRLVPKQLRSVPVWLVRNNLKFFNRFFKYSSALGEKGVDRFGNVLKDISQKNSAYLDVVSLFDKSERKAVLANSGKGDVLESWSAQYFKGESFVDDMLRFETRFVLPDNMLLKTDRMSMAHGLEARTPFLDHNLVDYSFSLKNNLKLNMASEKWILKQAMRARLPKTILQRKKHRFYVPIDAWFGNIASRFDAVLNESYISQQGIFKKQYIDEILGNYENSNLYYARQLWSLVSFQLWYETFINQNKTKTLII